MKICVNSQTPPLKFKLGFSELLEKYAPVDDPLDASMLEEGIDYERSPGGVTSMIYPLLRAMLEKKIISEVRWVATGVNYPPRVKFDDIIIEHVEIEESVTRRYTEFKESLWLEIHGLPSKGFWVEGYTGFVEYNLRHYKQLSKHIDLVDAFYVQDFQQLLVGQLIGPSAPAILRWHVPFKAENLNPRIRRFVLKAVEGFDGIVVSTRRDLESLVRSGYHGKAFQVYPYVDPAEWKGVPKSELERLKNALSIKDERVLLMVARMDPIKAHDVAIKALSRVKQDVKLVIVGDGSFSSSAKGGLAHSKGASWRASLEKLAKELHVEDRVVFTGYLGKRELEAAYALSSVVLLTSKIEGFGITVLEAWVNKKPVIVSDGAGVSELVVDGSNGYVFPSGDDKALAQKIEQALKADTDSLGSNGYETAKMCHLERACERERAILAEVVGEYK